MFSNETIMKTGKKFQNVPPDPRLDHTTFNKWMINFYGSFCMIGEQINRQISILLSGFLVSTIYLLTDLIFIFFISLMYGIDLSILLLYIEMVLTFFNNSSKEFFNVSVSFLLLLSTFLSCKIYKTTRVKICILIVKYFYNFS